MSKTVPFASSITKNITVFPALSKFKIKLICWVFLGSSQELAFYLNLLQGFYNFLWNKVIWQTTSCVIISLTSSKFSKVFICFNIIIYWFIKNVVFINPDIEVFYFYFSREIFWMLCSTIFIFKRYYKKSIYSLKTWIN